MIVINGMPPHTCRCLKCGLSWDPPPVTQGKNKDVHTDASLNKAVHAHRCNG